MTIRMGVIGVNNFHKRNGAGVTDCNRNLHKLTLEVVQDRQALMMLSWNKKKYFERNGGFLLFSEEDGLRIKQYSAHKLKEATNNFSTKNQLVASGQGTVYKGTLKGGTPVAVKLCNRIEPASASAFITELILASKILHRHIVKLLGCCLETEVPMLVYERLVNGDLAHHLQRDRDSKDEDRFSLSWETRLKIALQIGEGLKYLHGQAGNGILHRDVNTNNILLDNTFTAKLADFGGSKDVPGSPGYMDPEYMETGRYTDKSDVYSFGVVLAELLTGKRPVYTYMSSVTWDDISVILGDYFKTLRTEHIMGTFLDARVKRQGKKESLETTIEIAKRCLEREGRNRPKMKEVVIELEKSMSRQNEVYAEEIEEPDYEASPLGGQLTRHQGSQSSDHDDAWKPTGSAPPTPRIHQDCEASDPCGASEATHHVADQEVTSHDGQERKVSDSVKGKRHSKPAGQSVWPLLGQRTV